MRELRQEDWPAVKAIYEQGIAGGNATFETEAPSWDDWDRRTSRATGWWPSRAAKSSAGRRSRRSRSAASTRASPRTASTSPTTRRVAASAERCSSELIARAERGGIWTIQTGIFPENEASIELHKRCGFRVVGVRERIGRAPRRLARRRLHGARGLHDEGRGGGHRERVETVIDAVEQQTGHVGVTVVEAIGHGRQRGITHEYRGRVFESRFLPKAVLTFVVADEIADAVVDAIVDAARSGNESGDGIVWTTPVETPSRTTGPAMRSEEVERV